LYFFPPWFSLILLHPSHHLSTYSEMSKIHTQTLVIKQKFNLNINTPDQHDSIIYIRTVYTAATHTDFMRIVTPKWLKPFYDK
jgi:hypothetical protein